MLILCYVLDHPKIPMVNAQRQLCITIHNFLLMVSLKLHFFRMLHELVIKQSNLVSNSCIYCNTTYLELVKHKSNKDDYKLIFFIATIIKPLMTFKMLIEGWL